MRHILPLTLIALAAPALAQTSEPMTAITYPATERGTTVDEQFGVKVADPYRWLENDVRTDPKVAAWVADENKVTDAYLATLPGRDMFKARLKQLIDYERFGPPEEGRPLFLHAQYRPAEPGGAVRPRQRGWRRAAC